MQGVIYSDAAITMIIVVIDMMMFWILARNEVAKPTINLGNVLTIGLD